ncbi:FAD-dependent oxidoreductase, partial [Elizabethkingia meningoseptica]
MENEFDLIVIGGGVLGTFHAYHALEKGLKVAILEKDKAPQSATTRNFG